MGTSLVAAVVAAVVGLLLAVGTSVTLVQLAAEKPDPIDTPLVVYGER
jgi:hypothetical protein